MLAMAWTRVASGAWSSVEWLGESSTWVRVRLSGVAGGPYIRRHPPTTSVDRQLMRIMHWSPMTTVGRRQGERKAEWERDVRAVLTAEITNAMEIAAGRTMQARRWSAPSITCQRFVTRRTPNKTVPGSLHVLYVALLDASQQRVNKHRVKWHYRVCGHDTIAILWV